MEKTYWENLGEGTPDMAPYRPSAGVLANLTEKGAVRLLREERAHFKQIYAGHLHECPVCGNETLLDVGLGYQPDGAEQCSVCGWYDDWEQRDLPDEYLEGKSINPTSLNNARRKWQATHEPINRVIPNSCYGQPADSEENLEARKFL